MFTKTTSAILLTALTAFAVVATGCVVDTDSELDSEIDSEQDESINESEASITLTGTVDVYATTEDGVEHTDYYLNGPRETPIPLHFAKAPSSLRSGDEIEVHGQWRDAEENSFLVAKKASVAEKAAGTSQSDLTAVTGTRKALVIFTPGAVVKGTSLALTCPNGTCAASGANAKNTNAAVAMFNPAVKGSFAQFVADNSGNMTTFPSSGFVDVRTPGNLANMPQLTTGTNLPTYVANIIKMVLGPNTTDATSGYSHIMVVIPSTVKKLHAVGQVGGKRATFSDDMLFPENVAHEFGHNFGLNHAPRLSCGSKIYAFGGAPSDDSQYGYVDGGLATGANCSLSAYGNIWDAMGYDQGISAPNGHYNITKKVALGWLKAPTQTVCTSANSLPSSADVRLLCSGDLNGGRFVKPIEAPKQNTSIGYYGFQIPIPGDSAEPSSYYIEYRRAASSALGFGAGATATSDGTADGIFLYGWRLNDRAYLLDASPTSPGKPWIGTGECVTVPYSSTKSLKITNNGYFGTVNATTYKAAQISLTLVPVGQGC